MVFVVLGPFGHRCHPSREGEEEVPQTKPKHEISILAEMSQKKKLEKQRLQQANRVELRRELELIRFYITIIKLLF